MKKLLIIGVCVLISACVSMAKNHISDHEPLYTKHKARLKLVSTNIGGSLNLVLVPGGPGIDSEYFYGLIEGLNIEGNIWLLDLPDNGTNLQLHTDFNKWPDYMVEAINALDNVVILGHSYGGRLILSTPEVNNVAKAIILLNTAPISHFKYEAAHKQKHPNLPSIDKEYAIYSKNPSNSGVRDLAIAFADHYFMPESKEQGIVMLKETHYSHRPLDWAIKNFYPDYDAKYIPTIPTLVITSEYDHITPPYTFPNDSRFNNKPNVKIIEIKNAGHWPYLEQPERTKKVISDFVNNVAVK